MKKIPTPFQWATRHSRQAGIGHIRFNNGWGWFCIQFHVGKIRPLIESIHRVVRVCVQVWRSHLNTKQNYLKKILFLIIQTCAHSLGIHVANDCDKWLFLLTMFEQGIIWHGTVVAGLLSPLHFSGETISSRFLHITKRCWVPMPHVTGH